MDLSFFRRAEQRFASRAPARLEHGLLVAMLRAQSAAAPAAPRPFAGGDPRVELLLAGPAWREAAAALGGAFHPALARQRCVN